MTSFLPKVASTIKIKILLPKSIQEAPRDHWHHAHANLGKISNHKISDNSEAIGSSNLKFSQKVLTPGLYHPAKFQPPIPSGSKVITKNIHF